jgi:Flp pilus assembly protein TadG
MIFPLAERNNTGAAPVRTKRRRGVAATELAIIAPFLGALVMGMCEMGRAVMVKDTLTNAARKGCRTGATAGKTYQNIVDDVTNIFSDNNINTANLNITIQIASYTGTSTTPKWGSFTAVTSNSTFTPQPLDQVLVKVSIPVTNVLWFSPQFLSNTAIESETLTMVKQG